MNTILYGNQSRRQATARQGEHSPTERSASQHTSANARDTSSRPRAAQQLNSGVRRLRHSSRGLPAITHTTETSPTRSHNPGGGSLGNTARRVRASNTSPKTRAWTTRGSTGTQRQHTGSSFARCHRFGHRGAHSRAPQRIAHGGDRYNHAPMRRCGAGCGARSCPATNDNGDPDRVRGSVLPRERSHSRRKTKRRRPQQRARCAQAPRWRRGLWSINHQTNLRSSPPDNGGANQ